MLHVAWHKDRDLAHTAIGAERQGRRDDADRRGWARPRGSRAGRGARWHPGLLGRASAPPTAARPTRTSTPPCRPTAASRGRCSPARSSRAARSPTASDVARPRCRTARRCRRGRARSARGCTRGWTRRRRTTTSRAAIGNYGYDPGIARTPNGARDAGLVLRTPRPAGVLAQAVNADGSPAGSPLTMPGTHGDGRRPTRGAARRSSRAPRAAASTSRTRSATRPPTRSACGGSAPRRRSCSTRTEANRRDRDRGGRQGPHVGGLEATGRSASRGCSQRARTRRPRSSARPSTPARQGRAPTYAVDASATRGARRARAFGIGTRRAASTYVTRVRPGLTLTATQARPRDGHGHRRRRPGEGREGQGRRRSPARPTRRAAATLAFEGHGDRVRERLRCRRSWKVKSATPSCPPVKRSAAVNQMKSPQHRPRQAARGADARRAAVAARPGQASTRHRTGHELYVVLEGDGRMRVGE